MLPELLETPDRFPAWDPMAIGLGDLNVSSIMLLWNYVECTDYNELLEANSDINPRNGILYLSSLANE